MTVVNVVGACHPFNVTADPITTATEVRIALGIHYGIDAVGDAIHVTPFPTEKVNRRDLAKRLQEHLDEQFADQSAVA